MVSVDFLHSQTKSQSNLLKLFWRDQATLFLLWGVWKLYPPLHLLKGWFIGGSWGGGGGGTRYLGQQFCVGYSPHAFDVVMKRLEALDCSETFNRCANPPVPLLG